jgi:hypothetical protein
METGRVGVMKTTRGRWFVDSDSLILSYDNGQLMRIFSFPPGGASAPGEALAWILGTGRPAWLTDDDLRDLTRALDDMFGPPPLFTLPRLSSWHKSEAPRTSDSPPEAKAATGHH